MRRNRRVLFLQCTNAGLYPPILSAANILSFAGWQVRILSSPSAETATVAVKERPGLKHISTALRPRNQVRPLDYLYYLFASIKLALRFQPGVIYASDPLSTLPALAAAKVSGARVVYHEHDSPSPRSLRPWLAHMRVKMARVARLIIFPNEVRSSLAREELGFSADRLHIVWNLPRLSELPALIPKVEKPLIIYYHGSITPERLPETVVEAVRRFDGRIRLVVAGYEAPGAPGYISRLLDLGRLADGAQLVRYAGQFSRESLLREAASAHVGLALMPSDSTDINMRHMTGASNKAFDYMAAGLALLVSDLPDWRDMFVMPGFAIASHSDSNSLTEALGWFLGM